MGGPWGGAHGIPGGSPLGIPGGPLGRWALGHGPMGPLGRLALWTRAHGPRAHGPMDPGPWAPVHIMHGSPLVIYINFMLIRKSILNPGPTGASEKLIGPLNPA